MKRFFAVLLLAVCGCIATGPDGEVLGPVKDATDTATSVLDTVKKIVTFPVDLFLPAEAPPEAPKEAVPGGLATWIGSTLGGIIAGFLAGRLRKKTLPPVKP